MKIAAALLTLTACSTGYKPCALGGDTEWSGLPPVPQRGDSYCHQKHFGRDYLNHGRYWMNDRQGRKILEGEFHEGKKHGTWVQYDETGKKIAERYYERGRELPSERPTARPSGSPPSSSNGPEGTRDKSFRQA